MSIDINYLMQLGYSNNEIKEYLHSWNENIIGLLSDNKDNVLKNMILIKDDFDRNLLIKLPVFYAQTFCLPNTIFRERLTIFKSSSPDWKNIIIEQFYGCDEINKSDYQPVLKAMASNDISVFYESIDFLSSKNEKKYEFMVLLQRETDIDISKSDFFNDDLYRYESNKYEIIENAIMLMEKGLSRTTVKELIVNNIDVFCYGKDELKNALINSFGSDYIIRLETISENAGLLESFIELV